MCVRGGGVGTTAEVKDAIVYMKYDRTRPCALVAGDPVPPISLVTLQNEPLTLASLYERDRPLVIIAGSGS